MHSASVRSATRNIRAPTTLQHLSNNGRIRLLIRFSSTSSPATATQSPHQSAKKKKPALTLEHFLLRQRVLGLYRNIIRGLHALPRESSQRSELTAYARGEFERHREVTDAGKIRYLASTGKTEFEGMQRYLGEMGGRGM
jgi:hypothetical protein